MKMYIPEIGDSIRLTTDWTFDLYNESRNSTLMERLGDIRPVMGSWHQNYSSLPCTIPAGAVLRVDRVYIRKGSKDFSSVTFLWKGEAIPAKFEKYYDGTEYKVPRQPVRFWAKLIDVNNIEFEHE